MRAVKKYLTPGIFFVVFEAVTIHYAVAKIFGPLLFGHGWCGYACWTAMVLDFLPYKTPQKPEKPIGWVKYITFAASFVFAPPIFGSGFRKYYTSQLSAFLTRRRYAAISFTVLPL